MSSYSNCCVKTCKHTGYNSDYKFYKFPVSKHKIAQREKWIAAVNKINDPAGLNWTPKYHNLICSSHFIGGKKSAQEISPSYAPTIFSATSKNKYKEDLKRHERFVKRRFLKKYIPIKTSAEIAIQTQDFEVENVEMDNFDNQVNGSADKECQVFICNEDDLQKPAEKSFVCVRHIYQDHVDAEVQTDISGLLDLVTVEKAKKYKNKCCDTVQKHFVEVKVGSNEPIENYINVKNEQKCFTGYSSIKDAEQFIDLTGVSYDNFDFLLNRLKFSNKIHVSARNRLFILLMKVKTGLTFAAMGGLFRLHRTNVSRIFFDCLEQLVHATFNLVFWPNQETIRARTPDCFKPDHWDTRVILDCTEFRIETPETVENRVFCFSNYKHGFTFKVLFGCSPDGSIIFKSKAYGGRISDSHITVESGIIDLLEHGDKVLADKGFPQFQTVIENSGKTILLVMPPFLKDKTEFTEKEAEETYGTARVRIHIERIMQRLRTFRILDKIPEYLFSHIDDIIHLCSVLVNLQPPIIDQTDDKQPKVKEKTKQKTSDVNKL